MTEVNAYMNGYQPEGDTKFLVAALETHRTALADSRLEAETAKEFLYQHIQANKGLEKKVEHWKKEYLHMKALYDSLDQRKSDQFFQLRDANQKAERLEKVLNEAYSTIQLTEKDVSGDCDIEVETALNTIQNLIIDYWNVDPALETEGDKD
ncbi:hypothetical protein [Fictibacillus sp. JL2B1089]|uniref:hypothetical protein n=1 Tax=Fictibacillus sp. JL2B1089 TaxID=3399565 RepID=UPI003A872171